MRTANLVMNFQPNARDADLTCGDRPTLNAYTTVTRSYSPNRAF
jgi:hypothetical protein